MRERREGSLSEPVACTPAAGWEKGQVENQVGNARERLFTPRLHFANYAELNAWLEARCLAQARENAHPEQRDKTVWEVFEAERASLIEYRGPFDGFREVEVAVSKSSLVRYDHNRYSVAVKAARRTAQMRVYAERIVVWCDGEIVAEHSRRFGRGQTAYDPWHYLPILALKPGALRNGDPFRNWDLPPALAQTRRRLAGHDDGDRQFVDILTAVAEAGLDAVEAACAEALSAKLFGRDVVLNILARQRDPAPPRSDPGGADPGDRARGRLRPLRPAAAPARTGSLPWSGMRSWSYWASSSWPECARPMMRWLPRGCVPSTRFNASSASCCSLSWPIIVWKSLVCAPLPAAGSVPTAHLAPTPSDPARSCSAQPRSLSRPPRSHRNPRRMPPPPQPDDGPVHREKAPPPKTAL